MHLREVVAWRDGPGRELLVVVSQGARRGFGDVGRGGYGKIWEMHREFWGGGETHWPARAVKVGSGHHGNRTWEPEMGFMWYSSSSKGR